MATLEPLTNSSSLNSLPNSNFQLLKLNCSFVVPVTLVSQLLPFAITWELKLTFCAIALIAGISLLSAYISLRVRLLTELLPIDTPLLFEL